MARPGSRGGARGRPRTDLALGLRRRQEHDKRMARKRALVGPEGDPHKASHPVDVLKQRGLIDGNAESALQSFEAAARVTFGRQLDRHPPLADPDAQAAFDAAQLARWKLWSARLDEQGRTIRDSVERITSHWDDNPNDVPGWIKGLAGIIALRPKHLNEYGRVMRGIGILVALWMRERQA